MYGELRKTWAPIPHVATLTLTSGRARLIASKTGVMWTQLPSGMLYSSMRTL